MEQRGLREKPDRPTRRRLDERRVEQGVRMVGDEEDYTPPEPPPPEDDPGQVIKDDGPRPQADESERD